MIMKTENTFGTNSKNKEIICYCGIPGDTACKCCKNNGKKCNFCESSLQINKTTLQIERQNRLAILL